MTSPLGGCPRGRRIVEEAGGAFESSPEGSEFPRSWDFKRAAATMSRPGRIGYWALPMIYLDYQATTPVDPRALEAMLPFLSGRYGNPASVQHAAGRQAAAAVDNARRQVASLVRAGPEELIFTSGATEANNLVLQGVAAAVEPPGHMVSCLTEHPSVLEPLKTLGRRGWGVTYLSVDDHGDLDLAEAAESIRSDTTLVSIMLANNELGNINPLRDISAIARERGALVHADAVQAAAVVELDVAALGVDFLSISAHKLYGPQGVGALYVRRGARQRVRPLVLGGGQEDGLRSGTLNTPAIVGFGAAAKLASTEARRDASRIRRLRDRLDHLLRSSCGAVTINGPPSERCLPGSLHVTFHGADAQAVMANCPGIAMATGSACSSAAPSPSHVLSAIGMSPDSAEESLRLSVGRPTTETEIEEAAETIGRAVARVRALTGPSGGSAEMALA